MESTSERMRPEAEQDKQLGPNLERQAEWGDISEEGPTGLSIKLDVGGAGRVQDDSWGAPADGTVSPLSSRRKSWGGGGGCGGEVEVTCLSSIQTAAHEAPAGHLLEETQGGGAVTNSLINIY